MTKSEITAAVKDLIELAAERRGWSLAGLTRRLGKGAATLHRWRNGDTTAYDMSVLLQLCSYAEITLDEAFGLTPSAGRAGLSPANQPAPGGVQVDHNFQHSRIKGLVRAAKSMLCDIEETLDAPAQAETEPLSTAVRTRAIDSLSKLQQQRTTSAAKAETGKKRRA